jgi:hypothetical protein
MAVVISSSFALSETVVTPLTHARIGYSKVTGTITASSEDSGFPASAANNEMTYSWWKPAAMNAYWQIDLSTAEDVNYFGISAHTLGSDGVEVRFLGCYRLYLARGQLINHVFV